MRRWRIVLTGSVGVLLIGSLVAVESVYRSGLNTLTTLPAPPSTVGLSDAVRSLAWLEFEGHGPIAVEPTGPLRYAMRIVSAPSGTLSERPTTGGRQIASFCARHLIMEQNTEGLRQGEFSLGMASIAIWLSRSWTTDQIVACALNRGYYGHGLTGIEAAAGGYFGKPAADLSYDEAAVLIVALRAPSRFDPICNPSEVRREATALMAGMASTDGDDDSQRGPISDPAPGLRPDSDLRCASDDPPGQ